MCCVNLSRRESKINVEPVLGQHAWCNIDARDNTCPCSSRRRQRDMSQKCGSYFDRHVEFFRHK